jgi:hypothetical protein
MPNVPSDGNAELQAVAHSDLGDYVKIRVYFFAKTLLGCDRIRGFPPTHRPMGPHGLGPT